MKTLLLFFLILLTLNSYSQTTGNYQIEITSKASASFSEFKIHLLKNTESTKLIYFKRKQKDLSPTKQDSLEIQELAKTFREDSIVQKQLTRIFEKYKAFERDSLEIPSDHPLLRISDSLSKAETLQENDNDRSRIVLDGTRLRMKVRHEKGPEYVLSAVSPRKDTHPLLYQFITSALALYRSNSEKPILSKSDTQGY
ncbi:hypothetical protein [uncultured Pontibacter sp.]|uniref:hypothetical protein n=1 Tax=uncultured Pontibacter sp. TaxID=453356 RepID=UPI002620A35E|nr:hypothetical protein [uncultured Pontibacter sp.]